MNSKVYKSCSVPQCKNTTIKTPDKLFVYVPNNKKIRDKWLKLAKRDPASLVTTSSIWFCEDHFDLPNDMENYMQYHVMGSVPKVNMKPGCIPTKFAADGEPQTSNTMVVLNVCQPSSQHEGIIEESSLHVDNMDCNEMATENPGQHIKKDAPQLQNKSVQALIPKKFRSKATQSTVILVNQMTSPSKPHMRSVSTSPFEVESCAKTELSKPSVSDLKNIIEKSDSDVSYTPVTRTESLLSTHSFQVSTSDCSELIEYDKKQLDIKILECTLKKIQRNPRSYLGVPIGCYYLINMIHEQANIPVDHILLCLRKIRSNNSFRELGDDFAMDSTYASKIFSKNVPILASFLRPFIVKLDNEMIKANLPMAFRHKYSEVTCIIDCMEIEIQKSSKAVIQASSWSEYKKGNTIKYLISCTPNGLVNYISPGYSGRITDTCVVETCDFVKGLLPGMHVMADRGFKHVEVYLRQMGVLLVRPPSVASGTTMSKAEAKETKQIASLRIHIERVIRRLREFNMLKPHACLNLNLVKVLDDIITIASGLINLQDSLVK